MKWWAEVAGQIHYGSSTRATVLIEYDAGSGWTELASKVWSSPTSGDSYHPPNGWSTVSLDPSSVNSGQIQVRATAKAELVDCPTPCGAYNPTAVSTIVRMWEIEIWAEPPSLTVSPDPVVRGEQATFTVQGAPGAAISGWKYETTEPAVGTIVRATNTGASNWSGLVVAGGEAKVTVVLQEPSYLKGQTYLLERELAITPRVWFFPAVDATKQANPYTQICRGFTQPLVAQSPELGAGGAGLYGLCIDYDLTESDIGSVPGGPNEGLKWITDLRDGTVADWVMHDDVENPSSVFYTKQCGNWVPINPSCQNPAGTGFISGANYKQGIERHEAGAQNSHHAQYVAAQDDPQNNLKTVAERLVGPAAQTIADFLDLVIDELNNLIEVIESATIPEPCHQQCDETCTIFRGYVNLPNPTYTECPP